MAKKEDNNNDGSNPCMDRWLEDEDEFTDRLMRLGNGEIEGEEEDDEGEVEAEQVEEEGAKEENTAESESDDWEDVGDGEATKN